MPFTGSFMATSFKAESWQGLHNFTASTGNEFKLALYNNNASFTAATTAYTTSNEITGSGYTAGGNTLTNVTPTTSGTTAFTDFPDTTWSTATFTARGGMIYNSTNGNRCVGILDFGEDKGSSGGDFTIIFPTPDASNAILRFV